MSLRTSLHAYLRDTVDVPIHDGRLPLRPMMPALVQRFISAATVQTHSNRRSLIPRRVQIDAYANNDKDVDAVATRLLLALDGYHGPMGDVAIGWARLLNDLEAMPSEVKSGGGQDRVRVPEVRYRRILDFEVAYQELGRLVVPTSS